MAITALMILLLAGATQLPPDSVSEISERLSEACSPLVPSRRSANEREAGTALKMLACAQADFRANDRDGDGKNHFWRGDVAGLYGLTDRGGSTIQLIPLSVAAADARPRIYVPGASRKPNSGYWIRAIRHADENPKALDPNRFAFCAYPARPSAGRRILYINENNSIWSSVADGSEGPDHFPTDDELKNTCSRWG